MSVNVNALSMLDLKGQRITPDSLPSPDKGRWLRNDKYIVFRLVEAGKVPLKEVLERYSMDEAEYQQWKTDFERETEQSLRRGFGGRLDVQKRRPKRRLLAA